MVKAVLLQCNVNAFCILLFVSKLRWDDKWWRNRTKQAFAR